MNIPKVLLSLGALALSMTLTSCANAQTNIALNAKVTLSKLPNYKYAVGHKAELLTDGKYASMGELQQKENTNSLWVQKGNLGWQNSAPIGITIDLGKVQPISGASFSTAAGRASVTWPSMIYMIVSDDMKTWHFVGDLIQLSKKHGTPPKEGYANFRYATHDLHTKGRYISFGVMSDKYVFVDEIEVYKGDDSWLAQPASEDAIKVTNVVDYIKQNQSAAYARRRLDDDIASVRDLVKQSSVAANLKSTFEDRLHKAEMETQRIQSLPNDFKAILPLNDSHRDVFAVYGELLAAEGQTPLTVWKQHRYAWLPLLAKPDSAVKPQLSFSMLRNQVRSDALLITNASGETKQVTLNFKGAPKGAQPNWLQVDAVAWTDTAQGLPVADALLPLKANNGGYQLDVPAGMTRKVWVTIDSSKVPAGSYKSTFVVNGADVPMQLDVSSVVMDRPRLSLGMWDYINGSGSRGITLKNRESALKLMRSHFVDTPWATNAVLPNPGAADFDAQGNLKSKLDFSKLDEWIKLWSGARRYFVYASKTPERSTFAGAKMGTAEFDARVGSWAKAISAHVKELGLKPAQLGLLLVDESHSDEQDAVIAAWAKAINAAAPELTLFSDPMWARPDQTKIQDAITQMDILCPKPTTYTKGGKAVEDYFAGLQQQGKELWFYQCSGPVRPYNPQQYYRYQPWLAFNAGATGQGFWAFGDISGASTSWNEYSTTRATYAPVFIDQDTIYNSIHWDAVREGMEDYEELAMLQDKIKNSNDAAWKTQAQETLDNSVAAVTGNWDANKYDWNNAQNNDLADMQLAKVRALLEG